MLEIGDEDREISRIIGIRKRKKNMEKKRKDDFGCNKGSPEFIGSWL